ncbi:MAG TPA: GlsB/YeaQ/YmgE family stress response membrane protein, partial [Chitinophagaceae bacterium]|nr:GlsB/YeaQ/YmgE family stress response membrane protein [Chitinophagaceae bacterium]
LAIVLIGAAAGWLGSFLVKGRGLGLVGNVVVGILGSFVGSWILRELKVSIGSSPLVNAILTGAIGAFVILFVVSLFTGKS